MRVCFRCVSTDTTLRPSLRFIRSKLRQLLALQNAAGVLPLTPENVSRIYRDDNDDNTKEDILLHKL